MQARRFDEAEAILQRGVSMIPADSYLHDFLLGALGNCRAAQGRFDEAETMILRSLGALEEWRGPTDGNVYQRNRDGSFENKGNADRGQGQPSDRAGSRPSTGTQQQLQRKAEQEWRFLQK